MLAAGFRRHHRRRGPRRARRRRDLRAHAAGRGRRPGPRRGEGGRRDRGRPPAPRHAGRPGVDHLPRAPPRRWCARCWRRAGLRRGQSTSTSPSPRADRPGQPESTACATPRRSSAASRRRAPTAAAAFYGTVRRHGRAGPRHARGRDGQAAGEHLPARQHRAGQRDGAVLPRARTSTSGTSSRCAATKPFGFQAFYPGPGVGGHCIPIDPNYLSYKVRASSATRSGSSSWRRRSTTAMPGYVVRRVQDLLNEDGQAAAAAPTCCCSG